nr:hypothetical protein Y51A2A.10 - Caenorhabditis elegans [Caenorhabditis elegans]
MKTAENAKIYISYTIQQGTPRSARRNLTFNRHRQAAASVAPKSSLNHYNHHTGSGDGFSNNSLIPISDQERTEKYFRMRLTEEQSDVYRLQIIVPEMLDKQTRPVEHLLRTHSNLVFSCFQIFLYGKVIVSH